MKKRCEESTKSILDVAQIYKFKQSCFDPFLRERWKRHPFVRYEQKIQRTARRRLPMLIGTQMLKMPARQNLTNYPLSSSLLDFNELLLLSCILLWGVN